MQKTKIILTISICCRELTANQNTGIKKKEKGNLSNCKVDLLSIWMIMCSVRYLFSGKKTIT